MKSFIVLGLMFASASANAAGFICDGTQYNTRYRIYNETNPNKGTRNVAKVIISDQSVSTKGRKTIAAFDGRSGNGLARQSGATFTLNVDSRYKGVDRGGENIAGTKLKELKEIRIAVEFSYSYDTPSTRGEKYPALIAYTKEGNKGEIYEAAVCTRYLKDSEIK